MLMLTNQGQSAPFFTSFDGQLGSHSVELPSGTALVLIDLAAPHARMGRPGCGHSATLSSLARTEETKRASSTSTTSQRSNLHNAEC